MNKQIPEPVRIAHVIPSLCKGGAERLVVDVVRELSTRKGVEVQLVSLSDGNEFTYLSAAIIPEIIPARIILSISGKSFINIGRLDDFFDRFNPHIIHSHLFEADLAARWHIRPGARYFLTAHSNTEEIQKPSLRSLSTRKGMGFIYDHRIIRKKLMQCHDNIIAVSEDTRDYFLKNLPELKHSVHHLPNAIDLRFFKGGRRCDLNRANPLKMISVGRLHPNKNQILQLDIAAGLKQRGIPFRLHILGEGENRNELEVRIMSLNLQEEVKLPGNVDNVQEHLGNADLFIHTSIREAFGLVMVEAMACGLPVVCLDAFGNRDIILNGYNGFMVNQAAPEILIDKICEIWNTPELYSKMSAGALETAARYDIGPYCDKLLGLYYKALKERH